ncbi:DUF5667 domain-containing protein [Nocardioides bruguierae]|uniref:DUF5667 domain-containing protein n=1 Tax=Nocardioides bruguierae TaxID=2945102 RepID=UPI0020212639|nr:DUF5667 domain-containing protein [Nocardioides bruguierae]MCL8023838.1 DUF5667 domain-containing protein [Nocardioides bruguierae]
MSPVFAARRRAEEFDAQVEAALAGRRVDDPRFAELVEVAAALRAMPAPPQRPDVAADLRERLMAAAATELVPGKEAADDPLQVGSRRTAGRSGTRTRERRFAVAVGGLAVLGATTSVAVAAQSALPGESLYPVKRAIENIHTGFSVGEADRGQVLLAGATDRLTELTELSRQGRGDGATADEVLADFRAQTQEGADLLLEDYAANGDEATISQLQAWTVESMGSLADLADLLPGQADAALVAAGQVLSDLDTRTSELCPSCDGGRLVDVPLFLSSATEEATRGVQDLVEGTLVVPKSSSGGGTGSKQGSSGGGKQGSTAGSGGSGTSGSSGSSGSGSGSGGGGTTGDVQVPTSGPTGVGDGQVLGQVGDTVEDVVEDPAEAVSSVAGDVVDDVTSGVGDLVDGVGDGVGDLTDPLLGQ